MLWGILCVGLILLYLLSSTDWIIKEKEVEVYPVSLIISDTSDDDYVNFRKGVDQAAVEYNVDVSFITLYERIIWHSRWSWCAGKRQTVPGQ
ncbi:MAG: hypothetical protein ACLT76_02785 [Clostridium fessum]